MYEVFTVFVKALRVQCGWCYNISDILVLSCTFLSLVTNKYIYHSMHFPVLFIDDREPTT